MYRYAMALLLALCACSGPSRTTALSRTQSTDSDTTTSDRPGDGDTVGVTDNDTVDEPTDDDAPPPETDDPSFGDRCTSTAQCGTGLVCSGLASGSTICTVPCIGSGKGGNDDCPTGYACYNYESTTLDGVQICLADWQLGSSAPGYPFTTPPGGSCTATNNACQTQVCNTATSTCVTQCAADRDCAADEVCYAYPTDAGYLHICYESDLSTYLAAGATCSDHSQCDSGICMGTCMEHCRTTSDCGSDDTCIFWPLVTNAGYSGWTSVCSPRIYTGTGDLGDSCTTDDDCGSEWCLDNICTTPCATRDDCDTLMPGKECIQLNFSNGSAAYSGGFCLTR